jgi:predicted metal-dependent hydrolase
LTAAILPYGNDADRSELDFARRHRFLALCETIPNMIEHELLLRSAELFNKKLYFECHDLLEEAWSEAKGYDRDFLQSLIHVSVGMYHVAAGNHKGAKSLLERGVDGLERFLPEREGVDLLALSRGARRCLEKTERALAGESIEWEAADVPVMSVSTIE